MTQAADTSTEGTLQPPSPRAMVIGLLPSIFINGVLVVLIYQLVKHFTSISDVWALFISAMPAMIGTMVGLLRQKSLDVLGAFALITIAFSIVLTFFTGDARLFQIRESFLTVIFGIVCLLSLFWTKPLWFHIIRSFTAGKNPRQQVAFDEAWQYSAFRAYIRLVTIVWGISYVVEFFLRLTLIFTMTISRFLIISPIIFYGLTIVVIVWTLRAGGRLRKRADALRAQAAQTTPEETQAAGS
jgi:hypothetical protein